MKEDHSLVPENHFLKAPRKAKTQKSETVIPNRYWGIDMMKVMISTFGWGYLPVGIDWGTKKLLSAHMSLSGKSSDWIAALNEAVNLQFPNGIREVIVIPEFERSKKDLVWPREFDSVADFEKALNIWQKT